MGDASRLTAAGGGDNTFIAPKVAPRSGDFDPGSYRRDIRPNIIQVITLADAAAADEFTLTFPGLGTTAAFVIGTNAADTDIEAALQTLTGDAGLTVSGTEDVGPFTVTFSGARLTSGKPWKLMTADGTDMTATVAAGTRPEALLGQSRFADSVDSGVALEPPTIGTSTVTPGVDEVVTLDVAADVDGGTFVLGYKSSESAACDWDIAEAALQTEVDALFAAAGNPDAAPTVARVDPAGTEFDFTFTFENGDLAGRPVVGETDTNFRLASDDLTDGGVAEASTFSATTAGARGSISTAYTEVATIGDSVIASCRNVATGKVFDSVVDAATPVVHDDLEPGDYVIYLATVANKRVSRFAESAEVEVTSA